MAALHGRNSGVRTIKGIGTVLLQEKNSRRTSRAVWAAEMPDMLRVEIIAPTGHPVAQFAGDGSWIYLRSSAPERTFRKRASDATLSRLTGVPVRVADVAAILAGGVPMRAFDWAELTPGRDGAGWVLALNGRGVGVLEKITVSPDYSRVLGIEMFDARGRLSYRLVIGKTRNVDGHTVPVNLSFSDGAGHLLEISVQRCWINMELAPDLFRLEEK